LKLPCVIARISTIGTTGRDDTKALQNKNRRNSLSFSSLFRLSQS
jgi:hypothetical protein